MILESHEGGRWYERGVDGTECDWGRVLAWEPPSRVLFTWQINGDWQFDPDPTHASEIEVRFHADGPAQTTVEVEHRYFERLIGGEGVARRHPQRRRLARPARQLRPHGQGPDQHRHQHRPGMSGAVASGPDTMRWPATNVPTSPTSSPPSRPSSGTARRCAPGGGSATWSRT